MTACTGKGAITAEERRRMALESRRRGAAAQHARHVKGPIVDAYHRKVDIRAQVAAEDEQRRRFRW